MSICPKCNKPLLPFLMVFLVSSFSTFLTWLTLSYSETGFVEQIAASLLIFFGVGGTLLHYVFACMKRHCRHDLKGQRAQHSDHKHLDFSRG